MGRCANHPGVAGVLWAAAAMACSSSMDNASVGGRGGNGGASVDAGADARRSEPGARPGDVDSGAPDAASASTRVAEVVSCTGATIAQIIQARQPYFDPTSAVVSELAIVEFKNTDPNATPHTATSGEVKEGTPTPDGVFDTGPIEPGASVCVRFKTQGVYPFYCKFHFASMQGQITVK